MTEDKPPAVVQETSARLHKRADEVQREMTRYCAGLDHWDAMPVVVEGWLRVFEELQDALQASETQRHALTEGLRDVPGELREAWNWLLEPQHGASAARARLERIANVIDALLASSLAGTPNATRHGFHFHDERCYAMGPGDTEVLVCKHKATGTPKECPYDQQQCETPGCRDPKSPRYDPRCAGIKEPR